MSLIEALSLARRGPISRAEAFTVAAPQALRAAVVPGDADDLARNVYCVLGLPIDALDMTTALRRIEAAAENRAPFLLSTPNLNFLVNSRSDAEFRQSLLDSDLCPADGIPIIWIAWLLGLPVKMRISGSDIFEALKAPERRARQLKVCLFGGAEGVAATAAERLNHSEGGLRCVGAIDPGFVTIDEMSEQKIIDLINASDADLLTVAAGAMKGQLWLQRNHRRLTIAVRAHLGATVNFQAGSVKRAPACLRALGLEWLWRIKEEPHLWQRYWHDGRVLLRLLLTRVLPLAVANRWYRFKYGRQPQDFLIKTTESHGSLMISLRGDATEPYIEKAIAAFRGACAQGHKTIIDLSATRMIDCRFFGLLLMLRKQLTTQGASLTFIGASAAIDRLFRLNEVSFLLSAQTATRS